MTTFKMMNAFYDVCSFPKKKKEKRKKIVEEKQRLLLDYARKHSVYYRQRIPDSIEKWEDIPVTTKSDWMTHFDEISTDDRVTMDRVWGCVKNPSEKPDFLDQYAIVMTSGSTGKPIIMVQNRDLFIKDTILNYVRAGKLVFPGAPIISMGDFSVEKEQFVTGSYQYAFLKKFSVSLDCQKSPKELVEIMHRKKVRCIGGYTSQIRVIAEYCNSNQIKLPIVLIVCSGEALTDTDKLRMQEAFPKARVTSMYCCTEANCIATECECGHLHINEDFVKIEPVDLDYNVLPYDMLSSQTLVTVYENRVQPIIRYALGDKITLHHGCPCGRDSDWVEIQGRSNDLLYFDGENANRIGVAPMNLLILMDKFFTEGLENFRDYQIIQHPNNRLELRMDFIDSEKKDSIFEMVRAGLEKYLMSVGIANIYIFLSERGPDIPAPGKKKKRIIAYK